MINMTWDYTKKNYKKQASADVIWRLERQINYGAPAGKLKRAELKKYLSVLNIPADRKAFLLLLVWNKKKF